MHFQMKMKAKCYFLSDHNVLLIYCKILLTSYHMYKYHVHESTIIPPTNEVAGVYSFKQEAHGPHCSPEKTVQINKHI